MTAQIRDVVVINGERKRMNSYPPLPVQDGLVLSKFDIGAHEVMGKHYATCLHRGYVGVWELKDGGFYLLDVRGPSYQMLVPPPLFADWFSGELRIPDGELIRRGPGYVSVGVYERDWVVMVERGVEVGRELIHNR